MTTNELLTEDLRRVLRTMPRDLRRLLQTRRLFLGGGAIRSVVTGETITDWDLFGPSAVSLRAALGILHHERVGSRLHNTENAQTLLAPNHLPVQVITRWLYDDPQLLLHSFDFTVARAVVWHEDGKWLSMVDDRFYADCASRRLHYCHPVREEDAGGSMLRVTKFLRRGYNIAPESLGSVIARMVEAYRPEAGIDAGVIMTGMLREVDPFAAIEGLDVMPEREEMSL